MASHIPNLPVGKLSVTKSRATQPVGYTRVTQSVDWTETLVFEYSFLVRVQSVLRLSHNNRPLEEQSLASPMNVIVNYGRTHQFQSEAYLINHQAVQMF